MNKWKIIALVGGVMLVGALVWLYVSDGALRNGRSAPIPLVDKNLELAAVYYPGTQEAGLILLQGFGSDQVAMHSMASEFAQAGVHVLTFDFTGHGRSPGGIGFDNAQTDDLARQFLAATQQFEAASGLNADQIILMGHSMGARVALQAMTMSDDPALGLILLGAQVNLTPNQQAEVFTGVSDTDLVWVQSLNATQPATDVLLITGAWDDILPPAAAQMLLDQLTGGGSEAGFSRKLVVFNALVHNYEIYSPRVLGLAKSWAGERWGLVLPDAAPTAAQRIPLWLEGLAGLFLLTLGFWGWINTSRKKLSEPVAVDTS
ncbi:MAG: alpha/beta fold hydrolase, partial [Anaerolineae bacterium]|nr:alpha/beta fold hydrolase [Anaerolineae bacterium]